jgi:hypothetical protein
MKKMLVIASVILSATISFAQSSTSASGSTISAPVSVAQPTKKVWSGEFYLGNWGGVRSRNEGSANDSSSTDIYADLRRDIGNGQSLAVRLNAQRYQRDDADGDKLVMADPQLFYRNKNFYSSTLRLSFPVLEHSKETGRYELRYNAGTDLYSAGKFNAALILEARAYAYSENGDGQRSGRTRNGVGMAYALNDIVSPFFNALYDVRWNNSGTGIKSSNVAKTSDPASLERKHYFELGADVTLIPKVLSLMAYVAQERDFDAATELFEQNETEYNLELTAKF